MLKKISPILLFLFSLCRCSDGNNNSLKNEINKIDSIKYLKGSAMYKNYCLTCHGYTAAGTYYQPSLDSMYMLLKKSELRISYAIQPHEILISKKDSIDDEKIIFYIKQKYHQW